MFGNQREPWLADHVPDVWFPMGNHGRFPDGMDAIWRGIMPSDNRKRPEVVANITPANEIPLSRRVGCHYCRVIIDSNGNGTWQRGTGWFPKRRAARGSHSATNVKLADDYACDECVSKLKKGIPPGQMGLWDDE